MKITDIKNCPFCGSKPEYFKECLDKIHPNKIEYYIECQTCGVGMVYESKKEVITAWNLRKTQPAKEK